MLHGLHHGLQSEIGRFYDVRLPHTSLSRAIEMLRRFGYISFLLARLICMCARARVYDLYVCNHCDLCICRPVRRAGLWRSNKNKSALNLPLSNFPALPLRTVR